ncbi:hypothetical protein K469DRAFT_663520 [Zopfia rhizophila CBS 207.26]|uniref:Uncharacterized protein n=1 Tax=Zopfia rhizophila CBS 207.26 TaxID=1314779 RepID=A0A6A6E6D8_9PEZI|nr:hypothetical protein K469DRAFT_663520 [Zopfia rhizophila CBS 207.26]
MPSIAFYLLCSSTVVMIPAILLQLFFWQGVRSEPPFNNPPGVDIWCGKAYRETNSSFDPGGWLFAPNESSSPLLDLRFYPRMNLYLKNERTGTFIVDAPLSYISGSAYKNSTFVKGESKPVPFVTLDFQIFSSLSPTPLAYGQVPVNSTGNEFLFNLTSLPQHLTETPIHIIGSSPDGLQTYYSTSRVILLPARNDTGSVARIDRLYGGIQVSSSLTKTIWKPIFPYSFYTSWDWISSTINDASATKNLYTFRSNGYNIIHPIPPGGSDPFNRTTFEQFLKICDELELYVMYDMRHTYQNLTSISNQLSILQSHPSLLLYYTADEPDGSCDPLNATQLSYNHIRTIDPYHPVSLVLNCQNFYFKEYTSGADIILEDTYPIAVNTTFSSVYNTVCNSTYGDCGCDNCHVGDNNYPPYVHNRFLDISARLDNFANYQEWIKGGEGGFKKPVWGVPQAFWDNGSFWQRWPTGEEQVVMGALRINHGAKGIVAWSYPTSTEIEEETGKLAKLFEREEIVRTVLGSPRQALQVLGGDGLVDAAGWLSGVEMLVCVVWLGYERLGEKVEIVLPLSKSMRVRSVGTYWGPEGWKAEGRNIVKEGVGALEVGILKVSVEACAGVACNA